MKSSLTTRIALAILLILATAVGFRIYLTQAPQPPEVSASATEPKPSPSGLQPPETDKRAGLDETDFAAIANQVGRSVVNISTKISAPEPAKGVPPAEGEGPEQGDPFTPFFGPQEDPSESMPHGGTGSGFIVSDDGIILTNAHVVDGATEVLVKLEDRREFVAKVVGIDKLSDTAVLRIDAKQLPIVRIGRPQDARVGEWVLAIGSPFGFENTVTAGIISATARSLPEEGYVPFIQTDVAVNPGNSGGPLINTQGEVIGINSQIYSQSGGYQGLSFAIPIDVALRVEKQLLEKGKVTRGRLGVAVQDLSQGLAESFGLKTPDGALVGMVPKDGPGDRAGLKAGDVILSLNGTSVRDSRELPPRVADLTPGTEATLGIWRDGKTLDIKITVGELEEKKPAAEPHSEASEPQGRLGLAVRPLSPEEQKKAGVEGGLLVEKVQGPAGKAGILPNDIVLAVNGERVSDPKALKRLAEKAGHHVALLIQRGGDTLFIALKLK